MSTLTICLFGNLYITKDKDQTIQLKPATRSMLAYLLLYQYRHPRALGPRRELLASDLWSEYEERKARRCLSTTLWRLRRALKEANVLGGPYIITTDNDEIAFNFDSDHWFDVAAFEQKVEQGLARPVNEMTRADLKALEEAQSLYIGDLFEDCYDDWILRHREQLHLQYLSCLGRLMHYHETIRNYKKSIGYGRKLLITDPLREQVHRYLMRLYALNGQQSFAVQQYQICKQTLQDELGIEPMTETQRLYNEIKSGNSLTDKLSAKQEGSDSLTFALNQLRQATHALADAQEQLREARDLVARLLDQSLTQP